MVFSRQSLNSRRAIVEPQAQQKIIFNLKGSAPDVLWSLI
jgi:hypothetical protein